MIAVLGMPWALPWPFDREYMQLALIAALAVGACAPLIGAFLVLRRLSLLGDGIGHVAVAGVGAAFLADFAPFWTALVVAVLAALAIEWTRSHTRTSGDLALALMFYGGIAAGVVLSSKADAGANLQNYLFGSILTVSESDAITIIVLGIAIVATILVTGRALLAIALDEESARVAGVPVGGLNSLLAVLTAVTIVASMQIVGVLLIAALMVLPVAAARLFTRSFRSTLIVSVVVGMLAAGAGLAAARAWSLAPGGTIVLTCVAIFVIAAVATTFRPRRRGAAPADALLSGPH